MKRIILILVFVLVPSLTHGSTAGDFTVNPQSTYDVPPGSTKVLILDLTLPGTNLTSIKIHNAGTVAQSNLSQLLIYEDGPSPGWDGDESERIVKSSSPFWDIEHTGDFSKQRIFVTVDVSSTTYSGKTIKPELEVNSVLFSNSAFNGPTDKKITGFERIILAGTDTPSVPVPPFAQKGEAISTSTIRWHFTDLSNNEFGFKILDSNLKEVARKEEANISYIDETGLEPDTEYSGRQVSAFNDKGQSSATNLAVFPAVSTLTEAPLVIKEEGLGSGEVVEEEVTEEEEVVEEPTTAEELRAKIQELQEKIVELLKQLIQLLQQQISQAQASLFRAFEILVSWFQ